VILQITPGGTPPSLSHVSTACTTREADRHCPDLTSSSSASKQRPRLSLRQISAALAWKGFTTPRGKIYSASAVSSMLNRLAGWIGLTQPGRVHTA
jgi:hypothetical protein